MDRTDSSRLSRSGVQPAVMINRVSPIPIYHQLAEQLGTLIRDGELRPGDQLENEVAMATRLDISRPTVRRSIAELAAKGLVVRRRGVGTTVAHAAVHQRADQASLYDELAAGGLVPTTRVLSLAFGQENPRAARALGLGERTPLLAIERLRLADGMPIAVMRNWVAAPLRELSIAELERSGLYHLLRRSGVQPAVAHQTIASRAASGLEQGLLELGRKDSVLTVSQLALDPDGAPIEYGEHAYRGDRYRFEITLGLRATAA